LTATDAGGPPRHAAALRSATQSALQEIPLYLELANLLVELGNEAGIVFLFVVGVTSENVRSALSQGILPFVNLARMDLKSIGQFGYRLFSL